MGILLPALIFVAALLYSAVGHAGASGYIAAMALCGVAPESMKPAALVLNIMVAGIGTVRFYRAGCYEWRLFAPLAIGSIPLAFVGGSWSLPGTLYKQILGAVLLFAACRLFLPPHGEWERPRRTKAFYPLAVISGAAVGLLSGLTGTGGGIFLSPLLLAVGWADPKRSAGVSAPFILVNSIAGIVGHLSKSFTLPAELPYWAVAAVGGGLIGSGLGSRRLGNLTLRRLLAVVLVIAAAKLLFA